MGDEKQTPPEDFVPEAGEIEPAGGLIKKPPAPDVDDPPTEGDHREDEEDE